MTRSNRILNRLVVAVIALVLIALGAVLLAPSFDQVLPFAVTAPRTLPDWAYWTGAAIALVVVVLSVCWIATRGRGRRSALIVTTGADGPITVDAKVAADLISDSLERVTDVSSVGAGAYRMRGNTVLSLRVIASRGADLTRLVSTVQETVEQLDAVLGQRLPVLLQVVPGVRANLAGEQRVD